MVDKLTTISRLRQVEGFLWELKEAYFVVNAIRKEMEAEK